MSTSKDREPENGTQDRTVDEGITLLTRIFAFGAGFIGSLLVMEGVNLVVTETPPGGNFPELGWSWILLAMVLAGIFAWIAPKLD